MKNIVAAIRDFCTIPRSKEKVDDDDDDDDDEWKLPPLILFNIGKRLQSRLDIVRFRSVCRTWRSSLPAPTLFPLTVPPPPGSELGYFIAELTFYAVHQKVVALEEVEGGVFSSHALVTKKRFDKTPSFRLPVTALPRLSFLSNAYALHVAPPVVQECCEVLKIAIISPEENPSYARVCDVTVVAHLAGKKLAVLRLSKMEWETDLCNSAFEDVVSYQGRLYAVDEWGRVFVMDRDSLRMTKVGSALANYDAELEGERKLHLMVASGELYLLINDSNKVGVSIYRLSLRVRKWVEVEDDGGELGDRVVVMGAEFCNFAVERDLLFANKWRVPRFMAWPEYVFAPLQVVGSNSEPCAYRKDEKVREQWWWCQQQQHPLCFGDHFYYVLH